MQKLMLPHSRPARVARASAPPESVSLPAAFSDQLSRLYRLVQHSSHIFASPVGPLDNGARALHLPRFVCFGPGASEDSMQLAFLAGFDHRDLRPTLALLRMVEGLAEQPEFAQGLSLSFFPLVDVLGLAGVEAARMLANESWATSAAPEIRLLERDARLRGYQGFIRLESASGDDAVTVRLRSAAPFENAAPALELISSEDLDPLPVRWESEAADEPRRGTLAIADDLPVQPFELTLRIPAAWPLDRYAEAAASILRRFVLRYRGFISYAQHL